MRATPLLMSLASMKRRVQIIILLLLSLTACDSHRHEAKRLVSHAERVFDTYPDSTARLIDSVLRMPVYFGERQRMDMALLQAEAIFHDMPLDDDLFEDTTYRVATSPELERACEYYAKKKQYAKAAHAALYSGYVQQHYNEKETAMRSYKAAEQYGLLTHDSLTAARAEYRMGKMLYYEGRNKEALNFSNVSINHIGNRMTDLATIENSKGATYVLMKQFDSAGISFRKSLLYAEKGFSEKAKNKALNNLAVLYRLQGDNEQAVCFLKQMSEPFLTDQERAVLYLNLGKSFDALGEMDSVTFYFQCLESLMDSAVGDVQEETKVSAYEVLFRIAVFQGRDSLALNYYEKHKYALYEVMNQHQEQALFRIQKQYDYETLQNAMNQKLMRRHRIIIILSVLAILGLIAFALSKIRLARMRKQEVEAKTSLFHFMQKNKELLERQSEKETVCQELASENDTYKRAYKDYAEKYSDAKSKELETIIKLAVYVNSKGEKAFLDTLKRTVFNAKSPWDAAITVFDILYPNVRENIDRQHPELTEMERKDFILSFIKVSRDEEAAMLDTTIHTVDKLRYSVRKKCGKLKSKGE